MRFSHKIQRGPVNEKVNSTSMWAQHAQACVNSGALLTPGSPSFSEDILPNLPSPIPLESSSRLNMEISEIMSAPDCSASYFFMLQKSQIAVRIGRDDAQRPRDSRPRLCGKWISLLAEVIIPKQYKTLETLFIWIESDPSGDIGCSPVSCPRTLWHAEKQIKPTNFWRKHLSL